MVEQALARSFESIGAEYDRYRPSFPPQAADLVMPDAVDVAVDLGAGTGKFTALLLERARRVIAVEPSAPMLEVLQEKLPDVEAVQGSAERMPVADATADVVTVAQAFHWFDRDSACAEIARTLVPGGTLGLVWNHSDPACGWDRASHRIAHPAVSDSDATTSTAADALPGFVFVRQASIPWRETISREHYLRRWETVSSFLVADAATSAGMLSAIEDVLDRDEETRGRAEFALPQITDVFVYRRA